MVDNEPGDADANETNDRAEREIDASRDDDEGDANPKNPEKRGSPDEVFLIVAGHERRVHDPGGHIHDEEKGKDAEDAFEALVLAEPMFDSVEDDIEIHGGNSLGGFGG